MAEEKDVRSANVSLHNANDNDFLQPNYRSWALNYRSSRKLTLILTFHLISLITQRINETTNYPTLAEITLFLTFLPSKSYLLKILYPYVLKNVSQVLKQYFYSRKSCLKVILRGGLCFRSTRFRLLTRISKILKTFPPTLTSHKVFFSPRFLIGKILGKNRQSDK